MKKTFLILAMASLTLVACNNEKKTDADDKMMSDEKMSSSPEDKEERNKKTALASVEAFSSNNLDAVLKDVTPDGVDYGDGNMKPLKGLDSIKTNIKAYMDAFSDLKGENLKAVADGEWVMVWGEWSGTWKNDFMGQKATGKSYKVKDVDVFKFNDEGKMTEHHNVQSWGTIASQIGMKMQ